MAATRTPTFAERQPIANIAQRLGVSQTDFARQVGLSRTEVSMLWGGRILPPEWVVQRSVAILNLPAEQLYRPERMPIGPRGGGTEKARRRRPLGGG